MALAQSTPWAYSFCAVNSRRCSPGFVDEVPADARMIRMRCVSAVDGQILAPYSAATGVCGAGIAQFFLNLSRILPPPVAASCQTGVRLAWGVLRYRQFAVQFAHPPAGVGCCFAAILGLPGWCILQA